LLQDVAERPAHYSADQLELVERLGRGEPATAQECSALLLQFTRRTEAHKTEHAARRRITQEIVTPIDEPPAFEDQNEFPDAIKLI
jgi:hypothetical protein